MYLHRQLRLKELYQKGSIANLRPTSEGGVVFPVCLCMYVEVSTFTPLLTAADLCISGVRLGLSRLFLDARCQVPECSSMFFNHGNAEKNGHMMWRLEGSPTYR